MIGTIKPLVEVASTKKAYGALVAHLGGLILGGLIPYGVVGIVGTALGVVPLGRPPLAVLLAIVSVLAIAGYIPQSPWQVPRGWMRRRPILGAWRYGLFLGTGVMTKAPYGAWIASLSVVLLLGSPAFVAAAAVAYGLGRWLPLAIEYTRPRPVETAMRVWLGRWASLHRIDVLVVAGSAAAVLAAR